MSINSTPRKLALSGWLYTQSGADYDSPLKHQKFLFFYEVLSKVANEQAEFSGLKGYKFGPVFSAVWGDRNHEEADFRIAAEVTYLNKAELVDVKRAAVGLFIVQAFNEDELIGLTHSMHIWNSKETEIQKALSSGKIKEQDIPLSEADFSEQDARMISTMAYAYPYEYVKNTKVVSVGDRRFIFSAQDAERLTPGQYDVLFQLTMSGELENPVYASIDKEGVIIVD